MANYIKYDELTGQIKGRAVRPSSPPAVSAKGYLYLEGQANGETEYVLSGTVTTRPTMALTPSSTTMTTNDTFTITGVPVGCKVVHPDGEDTVNDGEVEWDTVQPGTYKITLELFPYLTEEFTLEVSDP